MKPNILKRYIFFLIFTIISFIGIGIFLIVSPLNTSIEELGLIGDILSGFSGILSVILYIAITYQIEKASENSNKSNKKLEIIKIFHENTNSFLNKINEHLSADGEINFKGIIIQFKALSQTLDSYNWIFFKDNSIDLKDFDIELENFIKTNPENNNRKNKHILNTLALIAEINNYVNNITINYLNNK